MIVYIVLPLISYNCRSPFDASDSIKDFQFVIGNDALSQLGFAMHECGTELRMSAKNGYA